MLKQKHLAGLLHKHRKGQGDYAKRLWTAMTLNLWYDHWIRNAGYPGCPASRSSSSIS